MWCVSVCVVCECVWCVCVVCALCVCGLCTKQNGDNLTAKGQNSANRVCILLYATETLLKLTT